MMSMLVICGVMIGYICSAVTDFVVTFADDADIVNLHNWSMGSFSGHVLGQRPGDGGGDRALYPSVWCSCMAKPIGAYQLGGGLRPEHGGRISGASARR